MEKSIILMGIKHCGKSTQGKLISEKLSLAFYDTDDEIKNATGKSPREIYNESGEKEFVRQEFLACKNLAQKLKAENLQAVIATGGGICKNPEALDELKKIGVCVFLQASEEVACNRIIKEIRTLPDGTFENLPAYIAKQNPCTIIDVRKIFHKFYEERTVLYKKIADITVFLGQGTKEENAQKILESIL